MWQLCVWISVTHQGAKILSNVVIPFCSVRGVLEGALSTSPSPSSLLAVLMSWKGFSVSKVSLSTFSHLLASHTVEMFSLDDTTLHTSAIVVLTHANVPVVFVYIKSVLFQH